MKNFPESLEIERQRIDDLEFEFFISDINSDDGITVSQATFDGTVLGDDLPIKVETETGEMKLLKITISPEAKLEK